MKQIVFLLAIALVASAIVLISCSEDANVAESYSTHVNGWMDLNSADFHGQAVVHNTLGYTNCANCHGDIFRDQFCHECHALYPHRITNEQPLTHAGIIADNDWQLTECTACHGANFAGGRTGIGCLSCHTAEDGPANCTTCHGLPPVNDETILRYMPSGAAGAHQKLAVEKGYACTECHAPVSDLAHTGSLPAEVTFAHAVIAGANDYDTLYAHLGDPNSGNATCAVYCHSNGRGGPPNQATPEWTADIDLTCTACHSIPPVLPHPQVSQCHNCHSNVSPASDYPNDIRFLVEQLHVNGTVEL